MKILVVLSGSYGQRVVHNLRAFAPQEWQLTVWQAIRPYPILPESDLILVLGEDPGVAEMALDLCKLTRARAVIAPVDRTEWLPDRTVHGLRQALDQLGVASVFPKPFCSLTESSFNLAGECVAYADPLIGEFARYFGKPRFDVAVGWGRVTRVDVTRAAPCGSSFLVARGLRGLGVNEATAEARRLHEHYPCLAATALDPDYGDTLRHLSSTLTTHAVRAGVGELREAPAHGPT